jgi:transposase
MTHPNDIMLITKAAEFFGTTGNFLRNCVNRGELPILRTEGRNKWVDLADVEAVVIAKREREAKRARWAETDWTGMSATDIMARTGHTSKRSVERLMERLGYVYNFRCGFYVRECDAPPNRRTGNRVAHLRHDMLSRWRNGEYQKAIAADYGCHVGTVRTLIRRAEREEANG